MVHQIEINLPRFKRGYHLITDLIEKQLQNLPDTGLVNIFIQHTSAAISLNENADPSVRVDFENFMNKLVPENQSYFEHTLEGSDDMPAHLKSSILGVSINIPIKKSQLNLGTWQGIYLCEFRNNASERRIIVTVIS